MSEAEPQPPAQPPDGTASNPPARPARAEQPPAGPASDPPARPESEAVPAPATPPLPSGRPPPRLVVKLRERREAYRQQNRIYRVAWVVAGFVVVIAGLIMMIAPGPALVVIPIGLAMLSLEFAWAEKLLETSLERGIDAKHMALQASRAQKITGVVAILCGVAAAVAAAIYLL